MLITNAKIYTLEDEILENGFLEIKDGLISNIGDMANLTSTDNDILDASGKIIIPGLIDIHTHLGLIEDSLGFEGDDANEDTNPITPSLRVIDGINPFDRCFEEAISAGVTTVLISPGSANTICGQILATKTHGKYIDDMVIDPYIAMKFALGENPKKTYNSKDQTPVTRMATVKTIRETLFKTKEYIENKAKAIENEEDMPDFEMDYEALTPVLEKKAQAHFHAHRADDIMTALRISNEFDLDLVIVHATEGYKVHEKLKDTKLILGPLLTDRSKPELRELTTDAPSILKKSGATFAMSTDHPETPLKHFKLCGAICLNDDFNELDALKSMTIDPAKIVGLDEKIGSLKIGKQADFVILDGEFLDYKTKVCSVFVEGVKAI